MELVASLSRRETALNAMETVPIMNLHALRTQAEALIPCSPLGAALGQDYEIRTGGVTAYFSEINLGPHRLDYKALFTAHFHAFQGMSRGGNMVYRFCMHTMGGECHECFAFFAIELASALGGTLTSVSSGESKTHKTICALIQFPRSACSLPAAPC